MSVTKSEILEKVSKNFPNLFKKDLNKLLDILISEIAKALANGERVELRDVMMFEPKIQKKKSFFKPKNLRKSRGTWKEKYNI